MLFAAPDLLLLDEPTNYLDLEGTLWLEDHLARYPHTVIVISHDRDLLDNAVDSILHLENGKLTFYRGGYSSFERQRRERQMLDAKFAKKQEAQRKHLQAFVDRFRAKAIKARQAQSRLKMLAKLEPAAAMVSRRRAADRAARAGQDAVAADHRARRCVGRLRAGQAGAAQPVAAHRRRRPHRAAWRQRQRQVDAGEAARRSARADARPHHARRQAEDRLFRAASARRIAAEGQRLRACAPADAGRAGSQGARQGRRHRVFRRNAPMPRSRPCPAARRRG